MSDHDKGVKVEALKYHTFAGKEYNEGDKYTVHGDAVRSTDEYIDTLRAIGFAKPVGEESAKVVSEVGSEEFHKAENAKAKSKAKDAPKESHSDTHVEPLKTGDLPHVHAEEKPVEAKPVEQAKPAEPVKKDVPQNKK